MRKTTDLLLSTVAGASAGDMAAVDTTLDLLRKKHLTCIAELFGGGAEDE